ncbi:MAG: MarR family transcriptional regulator [Spirochaetes bacterium]|nr:MarR family transcriptional regulator [Spirochaetota bacterium]MBU0955574.1 MarR family transcriptional regulator [Spirochaetota bacterium]
MSSTQEFTETLQAWSEVFMQQSMQGFIHFAKEQKLSMSQLGALFHLSRKGHCGVSGIGEDLGVSSAAASQMLDRLVQAGFITRVEDPADRRARRLQLTESGRVLVQATTEARQRWFSELAKQLDKSEISAATETLRLLTLKTRTLEKETPCCD